MPGQLVEHRLPVGIGQPAAEVADALAVELERPRSLGRGRAGAAGPTPASRATRSPRRQVIGPVSAVWSPRERRDQPSSLGTFLARLGCTRIGSPGIFGERDPKALFKAAKPQVTGSMRGWLSGEFRAWGGVQKHRSCHHERRSRYPRLVPQDARPGRQLHAGRGQRAFGSWGGRSRRVRRPSCVLTELLARVDEASPFTAVGPRPAGSGGRSRLRRRATCAAPVLTAARGVRSRPCERARRGAARTLGRRQHAVAIDLALEAAQHCATGWRRPSVQAAADSDEPDNFQVHADPAGHRFCLCWVKK